MTLENPMKPMNPTNQMTPVNSLHELRLIIRAEIHATAAEIRALKRWHRIPPADRPDAAPPATRFALHPSKRRATLLCALMAHSRGRVHLRAHVDTVGQAAFLRDALAPMDELRVQTSLLDERLRDAARGILAAR